MRLGVFTDGLGHLSFEETLTWLEETLPDVVELEVGTGGYSPSPHVDLDALADDEGIARAWIDRIRDRGFRLCALNANGNPLEHEGHDRALRKTIAVAVTLGVDTVACMSGGRPELSGGAWFPGVEDAVEKYWRTRVLPYWTEIAGIAGEARPSLRLCLELEPGSAAYNVSTVERLLDIAPNLAVNVDPSHFFWQGIDPLEATARLGARIGFVHGKDTVLEPQRVALDGYLDRATWRYATVGHGHPVGWWESFASGLRRAGYDGVVSIEHEDEALSPEEGIAASAGTLLAALGVSGVHA